jgi:hypothetical protein
MAINDLIAEVIERLAWEDTVPVVYSDLAPGQAVPQNTLLAQAKRLRQTAVDVAALPKPKYVTNRDCAETEAIAAIRRQFTEEHLGAGTGEYCMWLEDQLLAERQRHQALVESVEELGPNLAAGVLSGVHRG